MRDLDLEHNGLNAEAVGHLARSPYLKNLETLNLGCNEIGNEGIEHLVSSTILKNVTFLDLSGNAGYEPHLDDAGIRILSQSPHLGKIERLNLQSNGISDQGVHDLSRCRSLTRLRELDLSINEISDRGLELFAQEPMFSQLEKLDLYANHLEGSGIAAVNVTRNAPSPTGRVYDITVTATLRVWETGECAVPWKVNFQV